MKWTQRWISLVLCLALVLGMMPVTAFAEQDVLPEDVILDVVAEEVSEADVLEVVPEVIEDEVLLASTEIVASGYCGGEGDGTNLTWTLTADGVLTINGMGAMKDFSSTYEEDVPWLPYIDDIYEIALTEGISNIGTGTFITCYSLERFFVDKDNAFYASDDRGVLFNSNKTVLIQYPRANPQTSYSIPYGVLVIGEAAFEYADNLQSIDIPDGVTTIEDYAFWKCKSLETITFPRTMASLGQQVFMYCYSLQRIDVAQPNAYFSSDELGVLFDKEKQTLIQYPIGLSNTAYALPSSVLEIKDNAFQFCAYLEDIIFSKELVNIGNSAFNECTGLRTISLSDKVAVIESFAFQECTNLTSIILPSSVNDIRKYAFSDCEKLESVYFTGNAPASWGKNVFAGSEKLTIYYIEGATGWTDSEYYDAEAGTWNGYKLDTWDGKANAGSGDKLDIKEISIGDHITFGSKDRKSLSWEVLEIDGTKALLFCDYVVDFVEYGNVSGYNYNSAFATWCSDFFSSGVFSDSEKEAVLSTTIDGVGNHHLFFLSRDEYNEYFPDGDSGYRMLFPGVSGTMGAYGLGTVAATNDTLTYWLRSSTSDLWVHLAGFSEKAYFEGTSANLSQYQSSYGVCPALYIDLSKWDGQVVKDAPNEDRPDPNALYIEPLSTDEVIINNRGAAYVWFRVSDCEDNAVAGKKIDYTFGKDSGGSAITDGNGLFCVMLPNVTSKITGDVVFTISDFDGNIEGATENISVSTKPFSFSQSWEGSLGVEVGGSIGAGAGAGIGAADIEANAAKATAKAGVNGQFAVKNQYENGTRTLELTYTYDNSVGVEFKSGIEGTLLSQEITAVGASAGVTVVNQTDVGLKIEGYNPASLSHLTDVGMFTMQAGLMGQNSVWAARILDWINVGAHNQIGYTNKLILEAGASAGEIEMNNNKSFALGELGVDAVISYGKSADHTDQTEEQKVEVVMNGGAGFLKDLAPGVDGYALGAEKSNAMEISAKFSTDDTPLNLSYRLYDGGKKNVWWFDSVTEYADEISFDNAEMLKLGEANETMLSFVTRETPVLAPAQMLASVVDVARGPYRGKTSHIVNEKKGVDLKLPFSLQFIVGLDVDLSGAYVEEFSYEDASGIYAYGEILDTSKVDISLNEIESRKTSLGALLTEPINAVYNAVENWLSTTWGNIKDGVSNAYSSVTGTVEGWIAEIKSAITGESYALRSYAILAVAEEEAPDTDAAVAVTVGEPYLVNIYTDDTRTTLVSNEALTAAPLTITLGYTAEMLEAAEANANADLHVYWFDTERNLYICLDSVQDKSAMTVSAPAANHGEYILATDNAAPLISDFAVSNRTSSPTITALVSDFSGLKEFSFRLDGVEFVNETTLNDYYDPVSGVFTYDFKGLAAGEHTAEFKATDFLGNYNVEPFVFTFTVDDEVPVIAEMTVPTDPVSNGSSFPVTAKISDNEQLAGVTLKAVSGKTTWSVPMTEEDGVWIGEITGIEGLSSIDVSILAVDFAGNCATSETQTVFISVSAKPIGLTVLASEIAGGEVEITVNNYDPTAISGWLVCAAYDKDGKMLACDGQYLGLKGRESGVFTLTVDCDTAAVDTIKTFLIDVAAGYIPML